MTSRRINAVNESLTLKLAARGAALRAQGRDVISFAAGELDCPPPAVALDAMHHALNQGQTRYTATAGIVSLREAIVEQIARDLQVSYEPQEIVVTHGAKQALFNIVQVLCDPMDEVLIPQPYWLSYPALALLAEAVPVAVSTSVETGYKLTPEALEASITERSRVLILNSPSNPTGAVYTAAELESLAAIVRKHKQLTVLSDEIYDKIIYGGARHVSFATLAPDLRDRTVVVNGVSKSYAMTGLRLGYAAGPRHLIAAATRLQSHATSCANAVSQAGAEAALRQGRGSMDAILETLSLRRAIVIEAMAGLPGFDALAPMGTFYCFPSVAPWLGREVGGKLVSTAIDLAEIILDEAGLIVVPGDPFGAPDHVRLSFSVPTSELQEGLAKLRALLVRLWTLAS